MPQVSDRELEDRLTAAGESLADPPSSLDELLPLLDQVEKLLLKLEQSPPISVQTALHPLMKGLVAESLLKHSDIEVKVAVASCISEITRITAPDAPYDDDKMKDVFQLIVSSFENLSDVSSRSHEKRATILETVSKVRSCVIMLDLECDQMIIDMFQHFLKAIRAYHAETIFTSMESIMTLVIEESEDVSADLLAPLLATLRRDNQDVTPIARKLVERVILKAADKLRPYLKQAVTSLQAGFDDYGEVLATVCREDTDACGHSNESILKNQPVVEGKCSNASPARDPGTPQAAEDDGEGGNFQDKDSTAIKSPNSVVSNGINETTTNDIMNEADTSKRADSDDQHDANSTFKAESDDCDAQKPMELEVKAEQAQQEAENHDSPDKDVLLSPAEIKPVEADESLDKGDEKSVEVVAEASKHEASKPVEALNEASPAQSGSHPGESLSEAEVKEKREEKFVGEDMESVDTTPKKASEEESVSEAKKQRTSRRKQIHDSAGKSKAVTEQVAAKIDDGCVGDSEPRSPDQAEKPRDATKTEYGSSERKKGGKKSGHGKNSAEKNAPISSRKEDNGKNTVTPRKSPLKSTKHEGVQEETPRTSIKRKQTPGKEKASETPEYGKNLVGSKVKVWWPKDQMFYEGVIGSFDSVKKKHKVFYNDGDEEILNLRKERWVFLEDDVVSNGDQDVEHSSHDTSSDVQVKRKGNVSSETSKRQKVEGSPKSKLKDIATKSGGKPKDDGKSESESKENYSKPSKRSGDDKSKDQPQKLGAKGQVDSGKASGKSKVDAGSKQSSTQTPNSKGKTPSSGKSLGSGGARAAKSGSSKMKETEQIKEETTDAGKSSETPKGRGTEPAKRGRKRRK